MANYPFKINVVTKTGGQFTHYTASLVTDADVAVSASVMVDKINAMPVGGNGTYTEDEEPPSSFVSGKSFGSGGGANYLSASVTEPNTGSIVFQDVEGLSGGVDYYAFYGSKVCSVLGLSEGMPIYTENFKFSDSSTDKINYMSGQIISDNVSVKEGFKLSSQARVKSNLIWDDAFGEGYIQWVSGSITKQFMGYDPVTDLYSIGTNQITASSAIITNVTGNVTGNLTGVASNATTLNYIGDHNTVSSPAATADQLIFSGSESANGNGGDIVLKAGNNTGGNVLNANVTGGNIVLEPGGAGVITNVGAGSVTDGNVTVGGNIIPSTDSTYTIGGASNYWSHGYIDAITTTGDITAGGDILPAVSANKDLGSTSKRWNNIYTTDLQLSNIDKDKGNNVDGTRGDWTLQEGDENLYVINNISGKKYKIALIPMDDKDE